MKNIQTIVDKVFNRMTNKKSIHEGVLLVENTSGDFSYCKKYGDKDLDTPFLIASITKLCTTACVFILMEQGKLSLEDPLSKYVQKETIRNLHTYKGNDYSRHLTLHHLLFQTSGLPDVSDEGVSNIRKHVIHNDKYYSFDELIKMTKQQKPHFSPMHTKRAHYSSVNFDLLGKVVEKITQTSLNDVYKQFIFEPLELKHSYLPKSEHAFIPEVYYKNATLHRPKFIRSCNGSGGVVSNARECMIFIKAFFSGKLFSKAIFNEFKGANKLQFSMFPIQYGAGYMRIPLGGLANLFMGKGELVGHSGSTGSFAFYYPRQDLFFVGDVNQMSNPGLPVRLAMQLAMGMK